MPSLRTLALLLLTGAGLTAGFAAEADDAAPPAPGLEARFDAYLDPLDASGDLWGTLVVARDGTVLYERSFGWSDADLRVPNGPSTRYGVASVTKPFTIIAAGRLLADERLALEDPLERWLPDFPRAEAITIEQLLRHRAGIPHRVTGVADEVRPQTAARMVELARKAAPVAAPGEKRVYSSAGYSVLARVLELAGGRSYGELLDELVFGPVGAVNAGHVDAREVVRRRARGHFRGPRGPLHAPPRDLSFLVGAGSVFATPRDVLAVLEGLVAGAYGPRLRDELAPGGSVRWNGYTAGFRAFADRDGDSGWAVVFAGNLFTGAADLVRRDLPRLLAGEDVAAPVVPAPAAVPWPAPQRREAEGSYELGPGSVQPLAFEQPDLVSFGEWLLWPTGPDTLFSPQDYSTVSLVRGKNGSVVALQWGEEGRGPRFERVEPEE